MFVERVVFVDFFEEFLIYRREEVTGGWVKSGGVFGGGEFCGGIGDGWGGERFLGGGGIVCIEV